MLIPELNNAEIRRTSDGKCSVYDLIRLIGGQKDPYNVWKRISLEHPEVLTKCQNFRFPGRGQKETLIVDRNGWAYILGLLPGVMGNSYRVEVANLVIRYLDADVTLAENIVDRSDNEEALEHLEAKVRSKRIRNQHTRVLKSRGVTGLGYGICTNKTYTGLYGTTAAGLRKQKGLPKKANVRASMTSSELIEVSFAEDLSSRRILQGYAFGTAECGEVNYDTAKRIAILVKETLA